MPRQPDPPSVPWKAGCRQLRQMEQRWPDDVSWRVSALANHEQNPSDARKALSTTVQQLKADISARGVLCDHRSPCQVNASDLDVAQLALTVCVPKSVQQSRLCEPWGERWQQTGAMVGRFCATFDATAIASWHAGLGAQAPFLYHLRDPHLQRHPGSGWQREDSPEADVTLAQLLEQKPLRSRRHISQQYESDRELVRSLVQASALRGQRLATQRIAASPKKGEGGAWNQPRIHETCAVVGSGHDLRCGSRKGMGAEIDAHEKVFRANSAQHYSLPPVGQLMRLALRSVRGWKLLFLLKTRLHWSRAGKRTDYRIVRASQSLPLRHPIPARLMACSRSLHSDH